MFGRRFPSSRAGLVGRVESWELGLVGSFLRVIFGEGGTRLLSAWGVSSVKWAFRSAERFRSYWLESTDTEV